MQVPPPSPPIQIISEIKHMPLQFITVCRSILTLLHVMINVKKSAYLIFKEDSLIMCLLPTLYKDLSGLCRSCSLIMNVGYTKHQTFRCELP